MSKVQLAGNASGTGIFTIASPNSNTDRTLTLPDNTGTLLSSASTIIQNGGPAFSAYKSANQTISSSVDTKMTFDSEEFDTASCYDTSTNRFTPNVAGYYWLVCECDMGGVTTTAGIMNIRKNGVNFKRGQGVIGPSMSEQYLMVSALIYMNGTTDYAEVYVYGIAGGSITIYGASPSYTYFQGFLARAA